jgi:hypothetical protein
MITAPKRAQQINHATEKRTTGPNNEASMMEFAYQQFQLYARTPLPRAPFREKTLES